MADRRDGRDPARRSPRRDAGSKQTFEVGNKSGEWSEIRKYGFSLRSSKLPAGIIVIVYIPRGGSSPRDDEATLDYVKRERPQTIQIDLQDTHKTFNELTNYEE